MGRVTVSLPDELEAELDRYAQQRAQPVSQVVAEALVRFLREAIPPPSPPGEDALGATQEYVARLALQVERLRVSLDEVALWVDTRPPDGWEYPVPPRLPQPPWRTAATEPV